MLTGRTVGGKRGRGGPSVSEHARLMEISFRWMFDAVFFTLLVGLAAAGVVVRRWWFALAPFVVWPVFYVRLREGWWLYGVGDGWASAAVEVTLLSSLLTLTTVATGRGLYAFVNDARGRSGRASRV
jgi:hypothetical protein